MVIYPPAEAMIARTANTQMTSRQAVPIISTVSPKGVGSDIAQYTSDIFKVQPKDVISYFCLA